MEQKVAFEYQKPLYLRCIKAQIIVNKTDGAYREKQVLGHQYILEVEYFSQCVLNGEIPREMMEDTIKNMKVIEACFKSIEKETFIDV